MSLIHIRHHITNVRQAGSHINWRRGQDTEKLLTWDRSWSFWWRAWWRLSTRYKKNICGRWEEPSTVDWKVNLLTTHEVVDVSEFCLKGAGGRSTSRTLSIVKDRWRARQGVQTRWEQHFERPEKPEAGRTIDVPTVKNRQRVEGVRQRTVVSAELCK